jgi:hypothetical protein
MPSSPIVLVKDGAGPFLGTAGGNNVTPGNTISIKLQTPGPVTAWYLEIFGVDEVTVTAPPLVGVGLAHLVATPGTTVTFVMPAGVGVGRAIVLRSWVDGGGAGLTTTFGIYVLTAAPARVGAVGEKFEGDPTFGWVTKVNPIIRVGASAPTGPAGNDLGGTFPNPDVLKIHGTSVPVAGAPEVGKTLTVSAPGVATWQTSTAGVIVKDEGSTVTGGPHTAVNFAGAGVTASDAGGGVALVTIPQGAPTIQEEGAPLAGGPHSTLNFIGAGVTAANAGGGVASITIPQGAPTIQEEGAPLAGGPHSTLNFIGGIVTAADAGGGVANISVLGTNGLVVKDEGSTVVGGPHTAVNFVGAGVAAADAGGGQANVTVTGTIAVKDEGSTVTGGPHTSLNFIGPGIAAADAGGGQSNITVTGQVTLQEEGTPLAGGPHSTLNFIGASVTAADAGGGVASITIAGVTALPEVEASLAAGVFSTINSAFTRAGSRTLDPLYWPATIGALTRQIYFKADIEVSTGGTTANVRLQNITDNETVTGTALSTGLLVNTEVTSAALPVGVAAGDLKPTAKQYEVQVSLTGGGGSDTVTITNARLCVRYV